jgi:hypothetical protein
MADSILGLPTSKKFADESDRFYNHRRSILHAYPNGKARLTGILSMIPEEDTNDSIFLWPEKRYQSPKTQLWGTARLTKSAPSTGDADDGTVADAGATAVTLALYMKVDSTKDFKVGQVIRNDTDGVLFWVTAVTVGAAAPALLGYLTVKLIRAVTLGTIATAYPDNGVIRVVGSAYGEGASGSGLKATGFKRPYWIQNTTQIFRDQFEFPGSVLKMGLKYDKTGPYKEKAHDTVVDHMTSIERALLFGQRGTTSRASFDTTQEDLSVRSMSGIIEFLTLWDAGSTGISVDGATYSPYSFKGPSTVDTDDQKRIITNAAGTVSVDRFNGWVEKMGRYHTNKSGDKLCLLGSGALIALVKMFRNNSNLQVRYGEKIYGLTVTIITTPFGDVNLVTHPLFNEDATMTYWMLFLDIWNLKYRPLLDRDTRLLKNRQNNGDDFRRDEFLTEAGLELNMPESHMLVKNVQSYVEA